MTFVVPGSIAGTVDEEFAGIRVPLLGYVLSGGSAVAASRIYARRFVAYKTITITKIQFELAVAAGSNDNCDVGIYSADWQTLLGSAGSTPGKLNAAAPSLQTLNLLNPVNLQAGVVYYAAFAAGPIGTTAASVSMVGLPNVQAADPFGAGAGQREHTFQGAFPLAAPHVSAGGLTNVPVLMLLQ